MDTLDTIRRQKAIRDFTEEAVTEEQLEQVLNAGRLSGSSKNTQPWEFIVVRDRERIEALAGCGNFSDHLRRAPVAIAVAMPHDTFWSGYDVGRATQNMFLVATDLGLGTCIATMHRPECAGEVLGVPEGYTVRCTFSLGVPTEAQMDPEERKRRLGVSAGRKPLGEAVHFERWGQRES
jgi:nitroreductase